MEPITASEVCETRLAAVIVDDIVVVIPETVETIACDGVSRDVIMELATVNTVAEDSTVCTIVACPASVEVRGPFPIPVVSVSGHPARSEQGFMEQQPLKPLNAQT